MRPLQAPIKLEQDVSMSDVVAPTVENNNRPTPIKQEDGVAPVPLPEQLTFADLMAKDLDERLEIFDALPEKKKVFLLYPGRIQGLPARDPYPENWETMVLRATEVAKRKIESSFPKSQMPPRPAETVNEHSDDSDEDSDENSHEDFSHERHVVHAQTHGGSSSNNTTSNVSSAERNQLLFLENLQRCLPIITYGFHVGRHDREHNDDFCFCPCDRDTSQGTVAGQWRTLCNMNDILSENICNKNKLIQKKPKEFLDHVRTVKASCVFHRILYDFLDDLFRDFYGQNKKHIGFFGMNDPCYKAAIRDIKRKEEMQDKFAAEQMHQLQQVSV
jgi:hypothetical protein